jgi:exonuclease-1
VIRTIRYRGKKAGIDAYGWLYKGAYSCATELALGHINHATHDGQAKKQKPTYQNMDENEQDGHVSSPTALPTPPYIAFCLSRLELLLEYDITPIFVFDGSPIPSKELTTNERNRYDSVQTSVGLEMSFHWTKKEGVVGWTNNCIIVGFLGLWHLEWPR